MTIGIKWYIIGANKFWGKRAEKRFMKKGEYVVEESENDGFYSVAFINEESEKIINIKDVSVDKEKVIRFCEYLNKNKVSVIHLIDVFEEYFYC